MPRDAPAPRQPLAYLITFRTYGTWLNGDPRGSIPRWSNLPGTPLRRPHEALYHAAEQRLVNAAVTLDARQRLSIHRAISEVCVVRQWPLRALNVRTNHVHVVVSGTSTPEVMMSAFKAWSTRRLREAQLVTGDHRVWARHGSTRHLWSAAAVEAACAYVREQSGERHAEGRGG
jgi:REP element-mobilizing transposase RayT